MRKFACLLAFVGGVAAAQAEQLTLKIGGMICEQGCVKSVDGALGKVAGVTKREVKLGEATVTFDATKAKKTDLIAAIEKAGYTVTK